MECIEVRIEVVCVLWVEVEPTANTPEERDARLKQAAQDALGHTGAEVVSAEIL